MDFDSSAGAAPTDAAESVHLDDLAKLTAGTAVVNPSYVDPLAKKKGGKDKAGDQTACRLSTGEVTVPGWKRREAQAADSADSRCDRQLPRLPARRTPARPALSIAFRKIPSPVRVVH